MKKFHLQRLLKLADHLDKVQVYEFDMQNWYRETSCCTVACALGHACTMPGFKRAGLGLTSDHAPFYRTKNNTVRFGYEAATAFFDLDFEQARQLFSPARYRYRPTPKMVAKRIRYLVKQQLTLPQK